MSVRKFKTGDIVCLNSKASKEDFKVAGNRKGEIIDYNTEYGFYHVKFDFSNEPDFESYIKNCYGGSVHEWYLKSWETGFPLKPTYLDLYNDCVNLCDDMLI